MCNNVLFQKSVLLSTDTDESSYLQTSCEDSSSMDQSLLEHTYSAAKMQQSSVKRKRLATHSPVSNSRTPNERLDSPYTSPSSEGAHTLDIINSNSVVSEKRQNVNFTSISPTSPPNSTSVIKDKNQVGEDLAFVKRGPKKKTTSIMEEAVEALKKISNEKMPQVLQSPPRTPNTADACEYLGLFIAARLREMEPDVRLHCEIEIMKILTTREKNT